MSILESEIVFYGSVVMADDDAQEQIGGAIDRSIRISFEDISANGNVQVVSSEAADTTQTVTVHGRDPAGILINEGKTLNGQTVVPMTTQTTWERLLKAVKSAGAAGDVAVEAVAALRSNTAQGGSAQTASAMAGITLDTGASATNDAYKGKVLRLTGGTGAGQIRRIIRYDGATKIARVARDWDTVPDATTTFKISDGIVFEKLPNEVMEVRRPFYNAQAEAAGGSERKYFEKVFTSNEHGTLALTGAQIVELADPSGNIAFDLESSLNGSDDNGAGNNRQVAPSGYTFDSTTKNVANNQNHIAGAGQGIWLELTLPAGAPASDTSYTPRETGAST